MKSLNFEELNKIVGGDISGTPGGQPRAIILPTSTAEASDNAQWSNATPVLRFGYHQDSANVIF